MNYLDEIKNLQEILKRNPDDFKTRKNLAILLLENGFNQEALAHFTHIINTQNADSAVFYNTGILYEKLKDTDKALKAYEKAVEISPENIDAYYNLGLVYTQKNQFKEALKCFLHVLNNDDEDGNTWFNAGLCYFKMNDLAQSKEYFEKALEINEEDIYAHFYLGNIFIKTDEFDKARNCFIKVLELSPDYSWAYYNLALLDYRDGNISSSIQNLENTLKYNPKDVEAYKIYYKILRKNGNRKRARDILTLGLKNCPNNGDLFYFLSEEFKDENKDRQKEALTLALKNYRTLSASPEILKEKLQELN